MALRITTAKKDLHPGDIVSVGSYEFYVEEEVQCGQEMEINPATGKLRTWEFST